MQSALDMLQAIMDILQPDEEAADVEAHETGLPLGNKGMVMSHVYGLLRATGPEGATEFRNLPVDLTNNLGSAATECTKLIPNFQQACVFLRLVLNSY
jgi:hypothetical protein